MCALARWRKPLLSGAQALGNALGSRWAAVIRNLPQLQKMMLCVAAIMLHKGAKSAPCSKVGRGRLYRRSRSRSLVRRVRGAV